MHLICFGRILRPSHGNLGVWLRPGADSEGGDAVEPGGELQVVLVLLKC